VSVVVLFLLAWSFREPRYQGVGLSTWLERLDHPAEPAFTQAVHAVQQIGAAAVPALIELVPRQAPPKSAMKEILEKLSIIEPRPYPPQAMRERAWRGFEALGPKGISAIPQLTKMMDDPDPNIARYSTSILGILGPPAIPALRSALTHSNAVVRASALYLFYRHGAQDPETLAMGLRLLTDPNPQVRIPALLVLGRYTNSWDVIGRSWLPMLHDRNEEVRYYAIQVLHHFGTQARNVAPDLMQMLRETESSPEVIPLVHDLQAVEVPFSEIFTCLLSRLETSDPGLRPYFALALASYGAAGSNAVPAIEQWIKRSARGSERDRLLAALSRIDLSAAARLGFNTNRMNAGSITIKGQR